MALRLCIRNQTERSLGEARECRAPARMLGEARECTDHTPEQRFGQSPRVYVQITRQNGGLGKARECKAPVRTEVWAKPVGMNGPRPCKT